MSNHGHDHHQHHHHEHHGNERALLLTLCLTGGFMVVEVIGGLYTGSLALLADAGHMLTDTGALGLAWLGFRIGRLDADQQRSFGYARFEVLAGFVNGVLMLGIVGFIFVEALGRVRDPEPVLAGPMLVVAVIGLLVNVVAFRLLHGGSDHINMRGALLHVIGDMLGSVAAIIAALVISFTGWFPIDPLLSVLVGLLVLRSAWMLISHASHILLEGAPEAMDAGAIRRAIEDQVEGIEDVHHVHVWSLTSGRHLATLHVRIRGGHDTETALRAVKLRLASEFDLAHTTVQVCPEACLDEQTPASTTSCQADQQAQVAR